MRCLFEDWIWIPLTIYLHLMHTNTSSAQCHWIWQAKWSRGKSCHGCQDCWQCFWHRIILAMINKHLKGSQRFMIRGTLFLSDSNIAIFGQFSRPWTDMTKHRRTVLEATENKRTMGPMIRKLQGWSVKKRVQFLSIECNLWSVTLVSNRLTLKCFHCLNGCIGQTDWSESWLVVQRGDQQTRWARQTNKPHSRNSCRKTGTAAFAGTALAAL